MEGATGGGDRCRRDIRSPRYGGAGYVFDDVLDGHRTGRAADMAYSDAILALDTPGGEELPRGCLAGDSDFADR